MGKLYTSKILLGIALIVLGMSVNSAEEQLSSSEGTNIRTVVERLFGDGYKVLSIQETDLTNIFEVRINNELVYVNRQGTHMFIEGQLIQLSDGRNLTEERKKKILSIKFQDLPFEKAITSEFNISKKKPVRELAVFEDPNCGYCRKFRKTLKSIENLRVYTFLYPILGDRSAQISKDVWCSESPSQVWDELMLNDVEPVNVDDENRCNFELETFVKIGKDLGIQATPTIFLSSGERLRGAVSEDVLKEKLEIISEEK